VSYTLRGRLESRLAAILPVLIGCCVLAAALHRWWPVELCALMAAVGLAFDLHVWHRLFSYQPSWAAVPLGLVELAAVLAIVYGLGWDAPLRPALALFGVGWLVAFTLAQGGYPLLRLSYAEDGGELGRYGLVAVAAVLTAFVACAATWYVRRPPVVHLAAGVHRGPLVIRRREVLQGEPGAVVKGGIVVAHDDVQIRDVTVIGGQNGIDVDSVNGTVLDGVTVQGAKLDGIHVRSAGVIIRNCTVDMLGNPLGQGIDISFNMNMGMSMVEGCTILGGMQGITTHSSMTEIAHNRVSRTTGEAISVAEMSMGTATDNEVRDALGVGLNCDDQSICTFVHNTVIGTRPDVASGNPTRRGVGLLASFRSEAEVRDNELAANPDPMGTVTESLIRRAD